MSQTTFHDLRSFLSVLRSNKELVEIDAEVDADLEAAEIHRRVIDEGGPALLFKNVRGKNFPLVTNLFGTKRRVDLAFGAHGQKLIEEIAKAPEECIPPSAKVLWEKRGLISNLVKVGLKHNSDGSVKECMQSPPQLTKLPALKTWLLDGGPFVTLPLVYTQHPETGVHNLGMYRIQIFNDEQTGLHMQIGKGGGFHLHKAAELGVDLPVNINIGGPPISILSAIAPLPENVPELLLGSLLLGSKIKLTNSKANSLPMLADAEFVLSGTVKPGQMHPEGPFGDHYGYYSLKHDYPLFNCKALYHRKDAIFPATVVGKPKQEDFFIGDYLQELLSPLFPLVMPAVKDLWSYGETGFHSLAAAVVANRYKREAMVSAFRILGEGQLALTKFLLLIDKPIDLKNFVSVFEYVLERCDFRTDLYVFSNLSMDTLDYTGPTVNEGSKGVMLGMGPAIRELPRVFNSSKPSYINNIEVFCAGCLVVETASYEKEKDLAQIIAQQDEFSNWPMIVICDDAKKACANPSAFLWTTFTRFEPGADIHSKRASLHRFHPSLEAPIVIDARMKPGYPDELECDPDTKSLVDSRWREYFPK